MSSPRSEPRVADPACIAARYRAALEALQNGDLNSVIDLLDTIEVPGAEPASAAAEHPAWRAVASAHSALHDALRAQLGSAERELAELRQGQQVLRRMGGGR